MKQKRKTQREGENEVLPSPKSWLTISKCKIVSPEPGTAPGEAPRDRDKYDSVRNSVLLKRDVVSHGASCSSSPEIRHTEQDASLPM